MVQKKEKELPLFEWMEQEHQKRVRDNPVVRTKWYVVEITPPERYDYGDGHGGYEWRWTDKTVDVVSPEFDSKKDAQAWMDKHKPDEGKELKIESENLRKFTEHRWVSW